MLIGPWVASAKIAKSEDATVYSGISAVNVRSTVSKDQSDFENG
jgi:hypothetical protein